MKLRDMLELQTRVSLDPLQIDAVVETVQQWLYDRESSLERSNHHGRTLTDLISELTLER